ncbi:hypothetical protein ACFX5Q_31515 [Mesorhizobium sp. IMUNJ 23033]|uniref:hypothetical protein n=1 Tax=Mesorhizobium sp. IMUNJ 23033 TaxID=3378039 RepID=UPI00384FD401
MGYDVQKAMNSEGSGGPVARVVGQIQYRDIAGEERETHFRVRTAGHRLGEYMSIFPEDIGNHST